MSEQEATTGTVTYPGVTVELLGRDGNAFNIIGSVQHGIRHGVGAPEADAWLELAYACGSYDELLALVTSTVTVI